MKTTLTVTLFGNPSLALDGVVVRGFISAKAAALLYYLAATGRAHRRESLAALLWPESDHAQALKNLRDVLSNLRRLLEPYLDISRADVALILNESISIDCRRFEAEVLASTHGGAGVSLLQNAVARYRGPFLDGFSPGEALPFEEWARNERERLQHLVLEALGQLATQAVHAIQAIDYASRALAIDPLREEAHRQLMALFALSGQRSAALNQYEACRRLLHDELGLDPDAATQDLYRRILNGEVVGPATPPMVRPVYQLPAPLTSIVGRQAETANVMRLLCDATLRLVTLTGSGGVGKTTLALHIAHQLIAANQKVECFAHGIVFVALSALASEMHPATVTIAPLVATQIADTLGYTLSAGAAPENQVVQYLRDKDLLLILDNCEHLALDSFVLALLEQAPRLTILATSRGRINIGGEQVIELAGLAVPTGEVLPDQIADYAALDLFRRSAEAASPRLLWLAEHAIAASAICRMVGGVPLAINLAAGLVRLMPIAELAQELATNLAMLATTRRDLPERQRSLRAVFDHSWRLLAPHEQMVLSRLAVFRNGFTREAAALVAEASLPVLATLVDNSLVRYTTTHASIGRYNLLELVRQFANEHLRAQSALHSATIALHGNYYLALLSRYGAALRGGEQQEAALVIAREIDNIRAAWRWAMEGGEFELPQTASEGLFWFYEMRGWFREGAELFAQAAASPALGNSQRGAATAGRLLAYQGWCMFQLGQQRAGRALLATARSILQGTPTPAALIPALVYSSACAYYSGDYAEAEDLAREALGLSQGLADQHSASVALTVLGQIAALVGHYDAARHYSLASLELERELDNRWGMAFPLISLGRVAQAQGAYREAQGYFQEGLLIRTTFNDQRGVALCLHNLGDTAIALGEQSEAVWFYQKALAIFREIGNQEGAIAALNGLGDAALAQQEAQRARAAFGEALAIARLASSLPRILDAVSGIAMALAKNNPTSAARIATLVTQHPAAAQACRDRGALVLAQLGLLPDVQELTLDGIIQEIERLGD
jgi:predicted ATPase/DNA-binding SARP family transcriptional activator